MTRAWRSPPRVLLGPANGSLAMILGASGSVVSRCRHHGSSSPALGQRQDPDDGVVPAHRLDQRARRGVPGHRRVGAVLVARQVPVPRLALRQVGGDRERAFERQGGVDQLPPDRHQFALGKAAAVAADDAINDVRLARGLDLYRQVVLDHPNLLDQFCSSNDQVVDGVIPWRRSASAPMPDLGPGSSSVPENRADLDADVHVCEPLVIKRREVQSKESFAARAGGRADVQRR